MLDIVLIKNNAYFYGYKFIELLILSLFVFLSFLEIIFLWQFVFLSCCFVIGIGSYRFGISEQNIFMLIHILFHYYIWDAQNYD